MNPKSIFAIVVALAGGIGAGYWFGQRTDLPPPSSAQIAPTGSSQSPIAAPVAHTPAAASATPPTMAEATAPATRSDVDATQPFAQFDGPLDLLALKSEFEQTAGLYYLTSQADLATLTRYIDESKNITAQSDRQGALHILFLRFSEMDPELALKEATELNETERYGVLHTMFAGWAKTDLDGGLKRSTTLTGRDRQMAQRALMQIYSDNPDTMQYIVEQLQANNAIGKMSQAMALQSEARSNPTGALDKALKLTNLTERQQAVQLVAMQWAQNDAKGALAHLDAMAPGPNRNRFRSGALTAVAQRNPELALEYLAESPSNDSWGVLHTAMNTLAQTDPENALQVAQGLDNLQQRNQALQVAFQQWAQQDLPAAVAAVEEMVESGDYGPDLLNSVAFALAQHDPKAALALAERVDGQHGQGWRSVLSIVAQSNPEYALGLLDEMDQTPQTLQALGEVINSLAHQHPQLALAHLDKLPDSQQKKNAISNIAQNWAQQDPMAAFEWTLSLPEHLRADALQNMSYQIARHDPELAMALTEQLDNESMRRNWIATIVGGSNSLVGVDKLAWLRTFKDDSQYPQWVGQLAANTAQRDPRGGLDILAELEDPDQFQAASQMFAAHWAMTDPRAAAKWFGGLNTDRRSTDALSAIVSQWRQFDPKAAERWVFGLRATAERDAGIIALIDHDEFSQWRDLRQMIERISQPELRDQAYASAIYQQARFDPAEARRRLEQANLSPEQHAQIDQYLAGIEQGD